MSTPATRFTQGGNFVASFWSGALAPSVTATPNDGAYAPGTGHVLLQSGTGRLCSVQLKSATFTLSGVAINFYDAPVLNTPCLSGVNTFAQSGAPLLFVAGGPGGLSGDIQSLQQSTVAMPFVNGLCVSMPSGAPGFTCSWTSEPIQ